VVHDPAKYDGPRGEASGVTREARAATLQRSDGPAIAYDVAGDGPPVVFVHVLTNTARVRPLLADPPAP
jgi:hypothetical protein